MNNKTNKLFRWMPSLAASLLIVASAAFKFSGTPQLIEHYTQLGLLPYVKMLGFAECVFIALFLYPKTLKLGLLLLTAYFGGAMATELSHANVFVFPMAILMLVWVAAFVRKQGVFTTGQHQPTPLPLG